MSVVVVSGGVSSSLTVSSGVELEVLSGGYVYSTTILSGGSVIVDAHGSASGLAIDSGGFVSVGSGGRVSDVTVSSGGAFADVLRVSSGQHLSYGSSVSGVTVLSGGVEEVSPYVLSGGTLTLASGAIVSGGVVSSGGILIGPGEIGFNFSEFIYGEISGVVLGDAVTGSDEAIVASGGLAVSLTLENAALIVSSGARAYDTVVAYDGGDNPGNSYEYDYGLSVSTVVTSGALQYVQSGGTSKDAIISSGGSGAVASGGLVSGLVVESGGAVYVQPGAKISGLTVSSGGELFDDLVVSSGQREVYGPTASEDRLSGVTVLSGAVVTLRSPNVRSGGLLTLSSGVTLDGAYISAGGKLIGPGVFGSASVETVFGELAGATLGIFDGASLATVESGGVASGLTLENARLTVSSGGRAYDTVIAYDQGYHLGGAYEYVYGLSVSALVISSGLELVASGAVSEDATIGATGSALIYSGGLAANLVVDSGGFLTDSGEVAIAGAGTLDGVLSGSGAIVQTASGDLVIGGSGAAFSGKAAIEAGTIELATSGALGTGYIEFVAPAAGSAVLQIDAADAPAAGGTFANKIENFSGVGEDIDLRGLAYVAGASVTESDGVLVLADGGKTYSFDLAGAVATAYAVTSDGHGGTLIDPSAPTPAVARFTQAAAAFAPTDAAKTALVSSASPTTQTPFAHATASASR